MARLSDDMMRKLTQKVCDVMTKAATDAIDQEAAEHGISDRDQLDLLVSASVGAMAGAIGARMKTISEDTQMRHLTEITGSALNSIQLAGPGCEYKGGCCGRPTQCVQAINAFAKFKQNISAGAIPHDPTVGECMEGYATWLINRGRDGGRIQYSAIALSSILTLKAKQVGDPEVIQHSRCRARIGRSNSTIWKELSGLRSALTWAKKQGWIDTVPHIELPPQSPPRDRWLSREEADMLLSAADREHRATGTRIETAEVIDPVTSGTEH